MLEYKKNVDKQEVQAEGPAPLQVAQEGSHALQVPPPVGGDI